MMIDFADEQSGLDTFNSDVPFSPSGNRHELKVLFEPSLNQPEPRNTLIDFQTRYFISQR
jgi:hypothetical protein